MKKLGTPRPAALFGIFGLITLLFSFIGYHLHWEGLNPGTGESIRIVNLISKEGLHRILLDMVDNYTGFAPLGWENQGPISGMLSFPKREYR